MYAFCQDMPGVTEELARAVEAELPPETPQGCIAHVAGPFDGGWRIIDIWESEAHLARFQAEHLFPALAKVRGNTTPPPTFELRDVTSVLARA